MLDTNSHRPDAAPDRYWLCGDDCTTDCGACKGAGRPAARVDDPAAAVERVRALIDPETGMATGNGYDGTRLFDEKDIRAALAGLRDDRGPLAGQHTIDEQEQALKLRDGDQPLPVPNGARDVQSQVIEDIVARRQVGIDRYGTALQPHNGRDALRDAYEEAIDLAMYLKQLILERDGTR